MSTTLKTHQIVILGGHYGGLSTAHYLLRHVIPSLATATPYTLYHVSIVFPHVEYFWNIAAPRHLVGESVLPAHKMFLPLEADLKKYTAKQLTIISGKAVALSPENKMVTIATQGNDVRQNIGFDTLVIATGTTSNSALWQMNEDDAVTKDAFKSLHNALPKAKTILIGGGGAVGVETAGEIGTHFKGPEITILSGTDRLLPRLVPGNSASAENRLKALGVSTVHNLRVSSASVEADGTTTVVLSDGSSRKVDVYIDATGGKPNSSFLPSDWVNEKGYVVTDEKTFRAKVPGVYAVGDVASSSDGSFMNLINQVRPMSTSIGLDIATAAGNSTLFTQQIYKPVTNTQLVPIGPSGGVGQAFGWRLPSWLVWLAKSRTFFLEKAEASIKGSDFIKA
ncbi:amid-like mitochondrial oxidoreductase [Phlyctema vagabunda]|uniref:Amid-like mitochondrial oxidoreductase n=1 Tax=Phlyctema vagabunda TaxID=108571 RepID=A0ABR4P9H6_9HELO